MSSRVRSIVCAVSAACIVSACGRTAAPSTSASPVAASDVAPPAAPSAVRTVQFATVVRRDSAGRSITSGSSVMQDAETASDATNRRVRVLQVMPAYIIAHVGDTLSPYVALHVSGLDSAGAVIPRVTPLYGPLRRNGLIQALRDGRWLAAKPGLDTVQVRVMRHDQAVSADTALVRQVTVEVLP